MFSVPTQPNGMNNCLNAYFKLTNYDVQKTKIDSNR